jgi:hypothetical protein
MGASDTLPKSNILAYFKSICKKSPVYEVTRQSKNLATPPQIKNTITFQHAP